MYGESKKVSLIPTTALLFLGLLFHYSRAQEAQISISSCVDKSRITIGDLITYTVTVTHDKDVRVEMPGLGANLGGFEIRDYDVQEPKKKEDMIVTRVDYTISTFFAGEFEIPSLTVTYFTPGDSTAKALTTEKIKIVVESVKPSEAGDIRDIKPPVEIPRNWWHVARWFVLGGTLIGSAVLVFVLYRRKKAGKGLLPAREVPPRPPHEVAYEALDGLRERDLLERGKIKAFYTEVSEIIRQYIEGRYFIVAMEMTTTEVLEGLSDEEVLEEEFQLFQAFLERCDLVKFAKVVPSVEENDEILRMAYEIVDRTKVILEEPSEEAEIKAKDKAEAKIEVEEKIEIGAVAAEEVSKTDNEGVGL